MRIEIGGGFVERQVAQILDSNVDAELGAHLGRLI
jgi:hypothetical protein